MQQLIKLISKYKELVLYGVIGAGCASLDFIIYTIILAVFDDANILFANCIGVVSGIMASFTLNRQFNFRVKDKPKQRFAIFFCVGLLGLAVSSVALYIMVDILGYDESLAKILTIGVVSCIQFLLNKTITFKKTTYGRKRKDLHCNAGL